MKIIRHPLFMRPHPDEDLEQLIDRQLRRLPDRPAPETLLPRVLQAIEARKAAPWWRKSFSHWPVGARLIFLTGSSALSALMIYVMWGLSSGVTLSALTAEIRPWLAGLPLVRSVFETLGSALWVLARSAGTWVVWGAACVAAVSYLTTIGLGTVCWRLAMHRH
ncbi:MAG: hypothetical protein AB7O66_25615 [Limisphaerales bacterium]